MRILLAGHAGYYNRGCEAIVRTTVMMLRREFGDPEIALASNDHANDRLVRTGPGVRVIASADDRIWKRWTMPWALRQVCRICSDEQARRTLFLPLYPALLRSDAVLSVGGDNYTMDYGFPSYFLRMNRIVKDAGKKLVIWGASVGPFPEDDNLKTVVESLAAADLITAREPATVEYLRSIGITRTVRRVADPAFLLQPEEVPAGGILPGDRETVGFNISPILGKWRRNDGGNAVSIRESVAFLRRLIDGSDFHVALVPHVVRPGGMDNDHVFMQEIYRDLASTGRVSLVPGHLDSRQLKYVISRCRYFIGARTHSTIAALSSGVPTLSIGYSLKSRGINRDLFDSEDYMLPVQELTAGSLYERFSRVASREREIRDVLSRRLPAVREMAWRNVTCLRETLHPGAVDCPERDAAGAAVTHTGVQ